MALPAGILFHDAFNRVFRHLNPVELERCLAEWGQHIVGLLAGRHLVIDGKQLRGTTPRGRQAPVQQVSVWATRYSLSSLGQTGAAVLSGYVRRHWGIKKSAALAPGRDLCRRCLLVSPRPRAAQPVHPAQAGLNLDSTLPAEDEPETQAKESHPGRCVSPPTLGPTSRGGKPADELTTHLVQWL